MWCRVQGAGCRLHCGCGVSGVRCRVLGVQFVDGTVGLFDIRRKVRERVFDALGQRVGCGVEGAWCRV